MYLRTPKRYSGKRQRIHLLNLRWLWLYILVPVLLIPLVLVWDYREPISQSIGLWANNNIKPQFNPPTPTPVVPATQLRSQFDSARNAGNINNAIDSLSNLADALPNDLQVHTLLVKMRALRGGYDDPSKLDVAVQDGQRAVNADPEKPDGWIMLAMALDKNNKPQDALRYLLHARDLDGDNADKDPMLLSIQAEIENDLGNYDEAKAFAQKAMDATGGGNSGDLLALAYAHWINGIVLSNTDGNAATKQFEAAWQVALSDTQNLIPVGFIVEDLASIYLSTGRDTDLIAILTQAAARDQNNPMAPFLLGRVYFKGIDVNKAQTYFSQCLDINPDHVKCLRWLGQLYYQQGNFSRTAELEQHAIDKGATEPEAYLLAGLAYAHAAQPDCDHAVPILQQGIIVAQKSDNTNDRKANLRSQMEDGLHICNATEQTSANTFTDNGPTNTPAAVSPTATQTPIPGK